MEGHARGKAPQHADEAREQERSLQQADAEIGGEIGKMTGVLLNALIGIDPDLARAGKQEGASWRKPLRKEIARQPGAQCQAKHLVEPCLGDVQHEQRAGDDGEDAELMQEAI